MILFPPTCEPFPHGGIPDVVVDVMAIVAEDAVLFGRSHEVIAREVGVRWAGGILQTNGHIDRTFDPTRQILDVEVTHHAQHLDVTHAEGVLLGLDGFGRPAHDLEVVGEVAHEGDIDGGCGDAVVEGGYGHAESTSLASTFDKDVAGVGLRQGAEVVDASDAVEIGSAIVISVGTFEAVLNPVAIAVVGLVLALSAHADDGLDIFLAFNVEVPDVAAVS